MIEQKLHRWYTNNWCLGKWSNVLSLHSYIDLREMTLSPPFFLFLSFLLYTVSQNKFRILIVEMHQSRIQFVPNLLPPKIISVLSSFLSSWPLLLPKQKTFWKIFLWVHLFYSQTVFFWVIVIFIYIKIWN